MGLYVVYLALQFFTGYFEGTWVCPVKCEFEMCLEGCTAAIHACMGGNEKKRQWVCLITVMTFSPRLLFCRNTCALWCTEERSFKLWEHGDWKRQLNLSAQTAVNKHCSSKCLVNDRSVLVPLFTSSNLFFLVVWLKPSLKENWFVSIQLKYLSSELQFW